MNNKEFEVHMLNDQGKEKARKIAEAFDRLLNDVETIWREIEPELRARGVQITEVRQ